MITVYITDSKPLEMYCVLKSIKKAVFRTLFTLPARMKSKLFYDPLGRFKLSTKAPIHEFSGCAFPNPNENPVGHRPLLTNAHPFP